MYNWQECHVNPTNVMMINKAAIWAGRHAMMDIDLDWDLRIRLNDGFMLRTQALVTANASAKKILHRKLLEVKYPPTLNVDWEDYATPPLDKEWWKSLLDSIQNMGEADVAIYCMGGHGRTGTALSILAGLYDDNLDDPVAFIRRNYCQEAVESARQIMYIEDILGKRIESKPTDFFKATRQGKINANNSVFAQGSHTEKEIIQYAAGKGKGLPYGFEANTNTSVYETKTLPHSASVTTLKPSILYPVKQGEPSPEKTPSSVKQVPGLVSKA